MGKWQDRSRATWRRQIGKAFAEVPETAAKQPGRLIKCTHPQEHIGYDKAIRKAVCKLCGVIYTGEQPRSKYGNTIVHDPEHGTFHSEGEQKRFYGLHFRQRAGEIRELRRQVRYQLDVNGVHISEYRADFAYEERDASGCWSRVVEDFKGFETEAFRMKARLMKAIHNIDVRITK